jgi:hypothetical protein
MRYLGTVAGTGLLTWGGGATAPMAYEFEGYLEGDHVTCCGEIRSEAAILHDLFGRTDLQIKTEDGRVFGLRFSEKKLPSECVAAHVDVIGAHSSDPQDWQARL